MNPREHQLAVYAAEHSALDGHGRLFRNLREVRAYVDDLVASEWWADRWPQVDRVAIDRSRSTHWTGYALEGAGAIRLSRLEEPVVLHELAHVVTPGAGHGAGFVEALLALVRHCMGFHRYGALLSELNQRAVAR